MAGVDLSVPSKEEWLSHSAIAARFGVNQENLRKRLERWKKTHHGDWKEIANPKPNESKYLFRLSAVLLTIQDMKASGETSG
jgi:hypothetical protein